MQYIYGVTMDKKINIIHVDLLVLAEEEEDNSKGRKIDNMSV